MAHDRSFHFTFYANPLRMNTHESINLCTGEGSACDGAIIAHISLLEIISTVPVLPIG